MLNPSTADETTDDPTINRVSSFTRRAGCGNLIVVNLYAARATNPDDLEAMGDPCGPENPGAVRDALDAADLVVFAWGAHRMGNLARARSWGVDVDTPEPQCLGVTKAGHPRHPLYVAAATRLERWHA